jgi:hypothetical protein
MFAQRIIRAQSGSCRVVRAPLVLIRAEPQVATSGARLPNLAVNGPPWAAVDLFLPLL